jgi:hypothetical protein
MTDQAIISRKDAKQRGLKRYFTGDSCAHGHVSERRVGNGECLACAVIRLSAWRAENPEIRAAHRKKHKELHRDKENLQHKSWLNANPERKERYRLQKNLATSAWEKANAGRKSKLVADYRAKKIQRMPPWLNDGHLLEIQSIYLYSRSLNQIGFNFHVDHMVPLRGESVSGLHVPWNLQVIPAIDNIRKNNSWEQANAQIP